MVLGAACNVMREVPIMMALRRMGPFLAGRGTIGASEHDRPILQKTTLDQVTRSRTGRRSNEALATTMAPTPDEPPAAPAAVQPSIGDVMPESEDDSNEAN